ncbi:probable myosin-binding protein 5 [Pyrus communis]|uniref:probable myosin-binding protein 5 n=1 Tax=Pyrus communis TaxID=23211 RepID=UPI0035C00C6E
MACQMIHSWKFNELVGAFLDLAIAYLLLCAAAVAYFTSKFVGLFGFSLPCPCDGFFGTPRKSNCFQRQFADGPCEKISSVLWSVRSKFPFDVIWDEDPNFHSKLKSLNEANGSFAFEGEASCSSFSVAENEQSVEYGVGNLAAGKEQSFDLKAKKVAGRRPRLRRRRRGGSVDYGNSSSVSSYNMFQSAAEDNPTSPSSISKMGNEVTEVFVNSDGIEAHTDMSSPESVSRVGFNEHVDETKSVEKDGSLVEDSGSNAGEKLGFDSNETTTFRVLEQALEEEHAARAALYLELEKERSAAATAADEAMAMIMRLQEEKASIEMEAMQYQRMIEEKFAYDAEEMNILTEILIRREREKHFLENEVEQYRQMVFGDDQVDSSEDQVLKRASESITDKPKLELEHSSPYYAVPSTEIKDYSPTFGKELPILDLDEDSDSLKQVDMHLHPSIESHSHFSSSSDKFSHEFQEKEIVSMDEKPSSQGKELQKLEVYQQRSLSPSPGGLSFRKSTSPPYKQELNLDASTSIREGLASKTSGTGNENRNPIPSNNDKRDKQGNDQDEGSRDPCSTVLNTESSVLDVHVIDDKCHLSNAEKSERDLPTTIGLKNQRKIQRVSSDTSNVFITMDCPRGRSLPSDMRRYSMSAIDYERYKIDNEVERLGERLRIVQEGREKLNFSVGHRDRERIQLQLLEDIASHLREIRQLTEPGKAEGQVAMLPPLSKVMSKKRRWRTLPLQVHTSS